MPGKQRNKRITFGQMLFKGAFIHNPALIQVAGICPAAAAAVSLKAGALLAGVSVLLLLVTQFIASAFLKRVPRRARMAIYLLIGLGLVCPVILFTERTGLDAVSGVGIYLPLLAVNSLTAFRCEKIAVKNSVRVSVLDALSAGIGYAAVLLLTGFLRELLGSGQIAGKPVHTPAVPGFLMPFGGFLVLGFMAAALRGFVNRRIPRFSREMNFEINYTPVIMRYSRMLAKQLATKVQDKKTKVYVPELPPPDDARSEFSQNKDNAPATSPGEGPDPADFAEAARETPEQTGQPENAETPQEQPERADFAEAARETPPTRQKEEEAAREPAVTADYEGDFDAGEIERRLKELLKAIEDFDDREDDGGEAET